MKSILEKNERYAILTIKEKSLTSANSSDFKSEMAILFAEGNPSILLNLEEIDFIDSSGLGAILSGDRMAKENNGFLVIYGLNSNSHTLIKIAKLDRVLSIAASQQEAVDLLIMEELNRDLTENSEL